MAHAKFFFLSIIDPTIAMTNLSLRYPPNEIDCRYLYSLHFWVSNPGGYDLQPGSELVHDALEGGTRTLEGGMGDPLAMVLARFPIACGR
jgi:hypothetical protein